MQELRLPRPHPIKLDVIIDYMIAWKVNSLTFSANCLYVHQYQSIVINIYNNYEVIYKFRLITKYRLSRHLLFSKINSAERYIVQALSS